MSRAIRKDDSMADGYLNFDTKINEKGFNDGISKLGSLGKSGLSIVSKAMTGAIAAVGTGAAAIIKSSLGVVANMEQQVGGVETLFKDSANTVIANANKAYKTARMSANNYMETVTSFSASLLQSLGGDTAKAASYADRAIVDMSDNANKMGTNMRDIQNAYQGFAKQNYTMLDILKLGYGGTKEEWNAIDITWFGNDCLKNATVHYKRDIPLTTAKVTTEKVGEGYTFNVEPATTYEDCYVYAAMYDENGLLTGFERVPLETSGSTTISVNKTDKVESAKVFVLSDMLQPVIQAQEFNIE